MRPIAKYIVVKTIEQVEKTESGLLLSAKDSDQMRYGMAKVFKVGTDVSVIKEEDEIYYDKRDAFTMLIDNQQYTVIQERDVVVVL